jgi:CubicO group peptidase (beta-lactamase class C family)
MHPKNNARKLVPWLAGFAAALGGLAWLSRPAAPALDAAAVDGIVQEALHAWQVPGVAVAVVRGDAVVYLKGFGVKALDGPEPVTPDTVFPLASCTKAFTTAAMAMLADEGKMGWDDAVRKHVPFFHLSDPEADAQVTLRDLVSHRTGLGSHEFLWYRSPWGREEVIRRIGRVPLKNPFRSTFLYQTTMFTTAGHAVELTSGQKWESFIRERLFEPLRMKSASCTTAAALQDPDHATPHRKLPDGTVRPIAWYAIDKPEPAGSINASARDLARWLRFQLGDGTFEGRRLVSAKNLAETHTPQTPIPLDDSTKDLNPDTTRMSYGMAWVVQDYRGRDMVSHAGIIDGFRCHLTLVPGARLGIALLNNLDRTWLNLAISNQIVDLLLGLPKKDWNTYLLEQVRKHEEAGRAKFQERFARRQPGTHPSRPLTAYAGTYEHPAYGTAEVALENGTLVWKWSTFTNPLEHFHYDTFVLHNDLMGYPLVEFTPATGDGVAAMKVPAPLGVEFKKVK